MTDRRSDSPSGGSNQYSQQHNTEPYVPSDPGADGSLSGSGSNTNAPPAAGGSPAAAAAGELSSGADFGLVPNDKTWLLVRKVPPKLNEISIIDKHFSKFGKVVNIKVKLYFFPYKSLFNFYLNFFNQVCYENDPSSALIQFSNTFEATAAIRSTEAIFNNRFIKVYWAYQHLQGQPKPDSPHGLPQQQQKQQQQHGFRGGQSGQGGGSGNFYRGGNSKNSWANKQYGGGGGGGGPSNLEGRLGHQPNQPAHLQQQVQQQQSTISDHQMSGNEQQQQQQQQQTGSPNYFQRKVIVSGNSPSSQGPSRVPTGSELTGESSSSAPAPTAPPLRIISPLERAAKMKELTSASQSLSDALANQRHLMGKMDAAKGLKEKSAILKLLQSTLKSVTELKKAVEKLQADLTPTYRSSKTFNRGTSATSGATSASASSSVAKESASPSASSPSVTTAATVEKDALLEAAVDEKKKTSTEVEEDNAEVADSNNDSKVEISQEDAVAVEETLSDVEVYTFIKLKMFLKLIFF